MTRTERIKEIEILLQQLRAEERVKEWLIAHPEATVVTEESVRFVRASVVTQDGKTIAASLGADIADARGQVFTTIFTNEAAAAAE
jgi:predicted YcjX-like family ATPase